MKGRLRSPHVLLSVQHARLAHARRGYVDHINVGHIVVKIDVVEDDVQLVALGSNSEIEKAMQREVIRQRILSDPERVA